jgi:hypothetical protein
MWLCVFAKHISVCECDNVCVFHRDSMQLCVPNSVCVYVSVATCICCCSRPCDSVSILISVQVFSVPDSVCQNVFSCGTVSIYFGQCPCACVILYIYCSMLA